MTLVVSLLDQNRAIQLSDRRLTSDAGPETEEYGKGSLVITRDVRVLMGLSGLATMGKIHNVQPYGKDFDLRRTIATSLLNVAGPEYLWNQTAQRLAQELTDIFAQPAIAGLPGTTRRCVIHFVGFDGSTDPPSPISTFVSNFHDPHLKERAETGVWDEFRTTTARFTGDGLMAQAIGTYRHITQSDMNPLIELMKAGKPDAAVIGKGVELFREWADRLGPDGAIGKQVASYVLPSNMYSPATTAFHSNIPQQEVFGLGEIRIDGPDGYATEGVRLTREDGPAAGPKLGRNVPCWCGSGKKYKRCHGTTGGKTMVIELRRGESKAPQDAPSKIDQERHR